jgi:hypothetical protein
VRLVTQRPDARTRQHGVVTANPLGSPLALERLGADTTLLGVGAEHVAGGIEEVLLLLRRQGREQRPVRRNPPQELGGLQQLVSVRRRAIRVPAVNDQGAPRASRRRS